MAISRDAALSQFRNIYSGAGLAELRPEELNDFEGLWKNSTDSGLMQGGSGNAEQYDQSWDQLVPGITQRAQSRFNDPGNTSPDSNVAPSGSGGGGGGTGGTPANQQFGEVMSALENMNAPQYTGTPPSFSVPGTDLSPLIDEALSSLMQGSDPLGLEGRMGAYLDRSSSSNPTNLLNRLEAARENLTRGTTAAMGDMRGILAERGLISMPGAPEGSELDATVRFLEPLQRAYLGEVRQAHNDVTQQDDEREITALQTAMGWSRDQAAAQLSAAGAGSARQQMLSQIALQSLDQNMEWNKFLAEFGLRREEVAAAIQSGNMEMLQPLLQLFLLQAQSAANGYV